PEVVEAIAAQAAVLNTHTRYLHEGVVAYAEALLATFPAELANLMLTCTGSEANDLALRIARTVTGGRGLIVTELAYHGVTAAIAGASPSLGPGNPLGPDVWTVPAPVSPATGADVGRQFADGVSRALGDMRAKGVRPAALLVDTIFSSDGVFADPPGFLTEAAGRIRAAGGLFIADEVQAGFGRVGPQMWGFARHGLVPDIVTMGKPMGNGHPVAGLVVRHEHAAAFGAAVRYFNTFGGNPVSCAAAMAVLKVIQGERLAENSGVVGDRLRAGLDALRQRHSRVGEVRGAGLFIGVDLERPSGEPAPEAATAVVNHMRDAGVLISATGPGGNILKIRPPLVFKPEHADILLGALSEALDAI
ncbi:MAG: aminotransferase class III-fold pyridoxal phosphate-dependent enzyme, partial [Phenylobacterium sp.]|nr:aminotransferase class III-fold pyridoxal phosphate-dependent enzyme [Phenylobacterium sp.]